MSKFSMSREEVDSFIKCMKNANSFSGMIRDRIEQIIFVIVDAAGIDKNRLDFVCISDESAEFDDGEACWNYDADYVSLDVEDGLIKYQLDIRNTGRYGEEDYTKKQLPNSSILKTGSCDFLKAIPYDYLFMTDEQIKADVKKRIENSAKDAEERKAKLAEKKRAAEELRKKALAKLTSMELAALGIRLGKKKSK